MTPEQQRIAIAEACGWTIKHKGLWVEALQKYACIPDYLNDLNAMHEVEKVLTDEQWPKYREELRTVVLGGIRLVSQYCKADLHATASQRAEAFLCTIGKWEEAK